MAPAPPPGAEARRAGMAAFPPGRGAVTGMSRAEARGAALGARLNWLHARRAGLARPETALAIQPEPRTIGDPAAGARIMAGEIRLAGGTVAAGEAAIWDLAAPDAAFRAALHGFGWLDDLAALGGGAARGRAQVWTADWIRRFGRGAGPGWQAETTARRVVRWINHAPFLLSGPAALDEARLHRVLGRQVAFLGKRWRTAAPGRARFETLSGLVQAALALHGTDHLVAPAADALAAECAARIDPGGGIVTRNPEELLAVFTALTEAASALSEAGYLAPAGHRAAIARVAPTLRALRHADGGLARFHGGGRGVAGRLDRALAASGVRAAPATSPAMGFARLAAGRTTVILDAAAPPPPPAAAEAHASTLALEASSGNHALLVGAGAGAALGPRWRRAGRATPSHSALALEGLSSARIAARRGLAVRHGGAGGRGEALTRAPRDVRLEQSTGTGGPTLTASHDGYAASHGLTHMRRVTLALDGRTLSGEDTLGAYTQAERRRLERAAARAGGGIDYAVHFHLHPDTAAELAMEGTAVALTLAGGEVWLFRHDGAAALALAPALYFDSSRTEPRETRRIVLSARLGTYSAGLAWRLSCTREAPRSARSRPRYV